MTDLNSERQSEQRLTINVDGVDIPAVAGELVIEAAERAGIFIPRFCYHPRMEPVGVCRMCLVEVSGPRGFSLQPSCYLRVADHQEIRASSPKAKKAQEGVLEFLLVHHPLDCPVCDKGGECPLQDQAMAYGPGETRFIEQKRHWPKPVNIGPLVALDRERCIQCARCTRFAADMAGEALIDFAFRGSSLEVAPFPLEPFSSYFTGNTVQICPVGALTARPYRFRSRPWDLEQAESTCEGCAVGCRIVTQSSAGEIVRYLGVDVDSVNQSWLCDRGRYGYEAVNAVNRVRKPAHDVNGSREDTTWNIATSDAAEAIKAAIDEFGPESVAFIGGSRLTNEDAFAFTKLAKSVIGTDSVDAQLGDGLPAELVIGLPQATINEAAAANAVLILNQDLREELPVLFLRLRRAATNGSLLLVDCSSVPTSLSQCSTAITYLPGDLARVAGTLVGRDNVDGSGLNVQEIGAARAAMANSGMADDGEGLVIICGRGDLGESELVVTSAAMVLHAALPKAKFLFGLRRSNVRGAIDMGLSPGFLPGRVLLEDGRDDFMRSWGKLPSARGRDTLTILRAAADGEIKVLVTLGADVARDVPDRGLTRRALRAIPTVISLATHEDATTDIAHIVLPVSGEGERTGTVTNIEGRVAPTAQKTVPPGIAWPAWMVATEIARKLGADLGFRDHDTIASEIAELAPAYRGLNLHLASDDSRREGVVVPLGSETVAIRTRVLDPIATPGIASVEEQGAPMRLGRTEDRVRPTHVAPPRTSGREEVLAPLARLPLAAASKLDAYTFRMSIRRSLYDQGTLVQSSPSLRDLALPLSVKVHPQELARLGIKDGENVRLRTPACTLDVAVTADVSISRQVIVLPARLDGVNSMGAFDLLESTQLASDVRLESI